MEKQQRKNIKYIFKSKDLSSDIIIFPELAICGYPPMDLIWEDGFIMENNLVLNEVASESTVPIIIGCIRAEKTLYTILQLYVLMENYKNIVIRYSYLIMMFLMKKDFFILVKHQRFLDPINDRSRKLEFKYVKICGMMTIIVR